MSDTIVVSQLPSMLLADLKTLMLGHFANFGKILRISCTTKGKGERVAYIQFSSSDEVLRAQQNGNIVNGHKLVIEVTSKRPGTQLLTSTPRPIRSTLAFTSDNPLQKDNKGNLQSTLSTYFQRASTLPPIAETCLDRTIPTASAVLDEAVNVPSASTSALASGKHLVEKKPNTCVKLEVYQGPSGKSSQSTHPATSTTIPTISTVANNSQALVRLRPSRSLREILNLDTSKMKIVKTVSASDALACQYFTGGRHPFPLAMMFGKIPGSVIMPVRSMIDSIKPGMPITDSTTETVWNTILQSVLKELLPQSAEGVLRESIIDKFILEQYMQLEGDVVSQELSNAAENEVGYEEDVMICCEDVVDAMLGLVCSSLIVNASGEELRKSKAISRALECCFRKLTNTVVREVVDEELPKALLDSLCEEVLEDVLESPIFVRHVQVVAAEALRYYRDERNTSSDCTSPDSSTCTRRHVNRPRNLLTSFDRWELTENWLQTSSFNIYKDVQTSDIESIINSDTSCSVGSSRSSKDNLTPLKLTNNEISNFRPSPTLNSDETVKQTVIEENGLFSSLKRKLPAVFKFQISSLFKRRRF